MVCVVVARNGEGDVWRFDDLRAARLHPIPQQDDVYATTPGGLADQYGREGAASLLRFLEGRDRSRVSDALESWRTGGLHSLLPPDIRETIWDRVLRTARRPPTSPADIVRIVTEDRAAREGRVVRSFPQEAKEADMAKTAEKTGKAPKAAAAAGTRKAPAAGRSSNFPDTHVITIATKDGANPKRAGTAAHGRFALYRSGYTVKQAKDAGITAADLANDLKKGFIKVRAA